MARRKSEKRLHPRLIHSLPVRIAANGYDFSTTTQNISCLGAFCHIDKYIPPFTRIAIKMDLPIASATVRKDYSVECSGVVVRSEDDASKGFNIAIFFNRIKDNQRKIISKYISQFIPKEPQGSLVKYF
jgi:hypothetical protein